MHSLLVFYFRRKGERAQIGEYCARSMRGNCVAVRTGLFLANPPIMWYNFQNQLRKGEHNGHKDR
jgi:hypothetical protein